MRVQYLAPKGQVTNWPDAGGENASLDNLTRVPFEGELASRTLWPESEKIFGHGYEVSLSHQHASTSLLIYTIAAHRHRCLARGGPDRNGM